MRERSRLSTSRLPSTRLTASRGEMAGKAAPDSTAAASTRRTRGAVASGRAASCTRTKSHSPSAARPARTDSCRLSPPALTVTGLRGCNPATSRSAFSSRLGGPTTTMRSISSSARNNSSTRASVVLPFNRTSALLPRPSREPEPAAATMAPTVVALAIFYLGARIGAAPVNGRRLGEDHPASRGLDHGRDDGCDRLVEQAPAVLDDDHGAVVQAADTLPRLLALTRHHDHYLLSRDRHRTHRMSQLVEVQDGDALEAGDPVEIEVVGHDPPDLSLGRAHQVCIDLDAGGRVIVDHLEWNCRILLHLGQDLEPAPATSPPGGVRGICDLLELAEHGAEDDQRHVDKAGLCDIENSAVDDHRGVEQHAAQEIGQGSAGQAKVESPPTSKHVRRAEVRKDQAFQARQPDDHVAGIRVSFSPDQEIAEQETANQAKRRPQPAGQLLRTLHGIPPRRPRLRPPL